MNIYKAILTEDYNFINDNINELNKPNKKGKYPIHLSIPISKIVSKYLINLNIDLNIKDYDRKTPLDYACKYGKLSIVKLLIKKGAKINSRSSDLLFNQNLLYYALKCKNHKVSREISLFLIENGVDCYYNYLYLAFQKKFKDVFKLLLKNVNVNECLCCIDENPDSFYDYIYCENKFYLKELLKNNIYPRKMNYIIYKYDLYRLLYKYGCYTCYDFNPLNIQDQNNDTIINQLETYDEHYKNKICGILYERYNILSLEQKYKIMEYKIPLFLRERIEI